jgi:hypothetical protein
MRVGRPARNLRGIRTPGEAGGGLKGETMTTHAPGRRAGRVDGEADGEVDGELDGAERRMYLDAAEHALRAYPGALGELVHRELRAFADFGYRLAGDGLVARLAVEVLSAVREGETVDAGTAWETARRTARASRR